MDLHEEIHALLRHRKMTLTTLAQIMKERTGKNYYQSLLSHKINDGTLKASELKLICEILEYKISYIDIKKDKPAG